MNWIRTILAELFGLFVDDGSFALAILAWIAFARLCLPLLCPEGGDAMAFFAGLALILIGSAIRRARS